ncbi:tRNA epoxyqueuosine(34) reductase QueG [Tissierella sp.]|uniref:tRNA epoxyqueuosine(34) reductase QueG n=1 Tax=Tissierella sp. TaxID=41274 RepID=UPI002858D76A|nr:tRNA epoxyqueuosine(34) reductase QueG [Tissierella sp.]MDR7857786.1 tRNA epoxyqueuosine(34) reductase QueG [Tissierella sp.]
MNQLNKFIAEKAKELNIDICGFTDALALINIRDYLILRKDNNIQTEFEEKDIDKRIDPKLTMPNCKSIIVIGISYNIEAKRTVPLASCEQTKRTVPTVCGRLSKSTWGIDYHMVLKNKMNLLIEELKKVTDFEYKCFVDTGPLIDRELAKKAGIGYYGKNCSIINDDYGSFIFLGYIMTNLDLDPSEKLEEDCGDCNLCIKACPTGALEEPYKLNPKKCISYLTQTKDNIPTELREKMGVKIYGCDTCQLVCPKNKDIKRSSHMEFLPKISNGYVNIEELLGMSNREFKKKYGEMAGSWRGKTILKRNTIIALANMKKEENLNLLISQLDDSNPMIKEYTEWAIVNIFLTRLSTK